METGPLRRSDRFNFYLHQDNLMWNRLQTIGVVQVATLGGAYAVRSSGLLVVLTLVLGIILTILVFLLRNRDELVRDAIAQRLPAFGYGNPWKWYACLNGFRCAWLIFGVLILADVGLGLLIWSGKIPSAEEKGKPPSTEAVCFCHPCEQVPLIEEKGRQPTAACTSSSPTH